MSRPILPCTLCATYGLWRIMGGHDTVWPAIRCRIPTYTGVVLTAQRGAPHLFVARYKTCTLPWRVRGAHKELGRSCLLVLDCSGAWRDIGSYVRCAVLPMHNFLIPPYNCIKQSVKWDISEYLKAKKTLKLKDWINRKVIECLGHVLRYEWLHRTCYYILLNLSYWHLESR